MAPRKMADDRISRMRASGTDAPVMYSELQAEYKTRAEIAKHLCNRCNELGKMQFDENGKPLSEEKKDEIALRA